MFSSNNCFCPICVVWQWADEKRTGFHETLGMCPGCYTNCPQRHHFADKGPYSQSYGFSSSHVWMWDLDHKEGWGPKNWCFWNVLLEKTLESHLDSKEIQPVHPKGNQSWIFIVRTDAEAEAPILWPPDAKSQLIGKIEGKGRRRWQRMRF